MEKVMVVPSKSIAPFLGKKNFITDNIDQIIDEIYATYTFVDRSYAEFAPEYKQIIPYAVLVHDSNYFLARRLKKQTEQRLHGLYSIGLGGHINPNEAFNEDIIVAGMQRELAEEVGLSTVQHIECAGIINDLTTDVSNYHIGLLYVLHTSHDVSVVEKEKMTGHWVSEREINSKISELESWSQIVWENRKLWNLKCKI